MGMWARSSYVDINAGTLVQEIPVGTDIRSVALSPDGRWIAAVDRGGAQVALIDADARVVRRAIATGTHPRAAVWDSANPRWLYVAIEDDDTVAIIDRVAGALDDHHPRRSIAVRRRGVSPAARGLRHPPHRRQSARWSISASRWLAADVPLAIQAADPDSTVPQGTPFSFESLAWAADGNVAWLPHEILSGFHPFQFQRVLFPSVSVVDLSARQEVVTNPNDPNGVIAGRKNLFDAIDIIDPTGNVSIVSQPCAAALHPNGFVGYVVACASEDLLVFDLTAGIAVDLIRDIPGDHPVGMTLDDTGQRAWVLSDQSKTLQMFDLANGNLTEHVKLVGNAIPVVNADTVDPALRAGLLLWFRANSSKGDFATSGNNWMSCNGCHLDGLVSTNQAFFDILRPSDPTTDALIGHEGLVDLFSTAPTPNDPSFNPHDIIQAMLDMGGLAPDRTGADRTGQVDPNNPPTEVVGMAKSLGLVIAQDIPQGPAWLLSPGAMPNATYDGAWCGNCHQAEYAAWSKSLHAHSAEDAMVQFCVKGEQGLKGQQYSRLCAGCHQPVAMRLGDSSLKPSGGVTCLGCHDTTRTIRAGGNSDLQAASHDWTQDHKAWGLASLETLRTPEFCGGCHQQFTPGGALVAIGTFGEYQSSVFAGGDTRCVDCHMPKDANGVADHHAAGGNLYTGLIYGDTQLAQDQQAHLALVTQLTAKRVLDSVSVAIKNGGAGHSFPTGVTDIREPWVEIEAVDASNNVLAHFGGPDPQTNLLALDAPGRLGLDIAQSNGTLLYQHQLSITQSLPFERRIPPGATVTVTIPVPATLPTGTDHLDAVLIYRNIRTQYYQAVTGMAGAAAPNEEMTRVVVQ